MPDHNKPLPAGTKLDVFEIERPLGIGGFSVVYLAHELATGKQVVIKEYMPAKWATRNGDLTIAPQSKEEDSDHFNHGRSLFFQEANTLAMLDHPCIVKVITFFSAYGTVYMVMEYHKGQNLQRTIEKYKKGLSEAFILTVFPSLLGGLKVIHEQKLLHLDIKPGNIHLRPGGRPLLLDFGASQESYRARQSGNVVTNGYSPYEQHQKKGYIGPWSDIYAIGATMRACIEGTTPQPSPERYIEDRLQPVRELYKKKYADELLRIIDWSMEVDPTLRPQSIDEILPALQTLAREKLPTEQLDIALGA